MNVAQKQKSRGMVGVLCGMDMKLCLVWWKAKGLGDDGTNLMHSFHEVEPS